jgi:hypothetical protein
MPAATPLSTTACLPPHCPANLNERVFTTIGSRKLSFRFPPQAGAQAGHRAT